MSSPARPNPSMASHLVAATARRVLRPLTQVIPANEHGFAVMDRVLRGGTLVVSRPRRAISVEKVDTPFAGERVRGDWVKAANVASDAPPILYIHGGAFSMCSPETHRGSSANCPRPPAGRYLPCAIDWSRNIPSRRPQMMH